MKNINLDVLQEAADYFFDKYGETDEVIGFQLLINIERNKLDKPDLDSVNSKFVQ